MVEVLLDQLTDLKIERMALLAQLAAIDNAE
jgi:hypothetical protein